MMRLSLIFAAILATTQVVAHEMTPSRSKVDYSHMAGIMTAHLDLFNTRKDIEYFEISVFDYYFEPIEFASQSKVVQVPYLSKARIEIYLRAEDADRAHYACTTSKVRSDGVLNSLVSTRICSRLVRANR